MAVSQIIVRQLGSGPLTSGGLINNTGCPYGETLVNEFHGRRYELARNGMLFQCSLQAPVVTTVAFALTYTGLCVYNPVASGKNLELLEIGYAFPVAPAAAVVVGLMIGFFPSTGIATHTTALTPRNCLASGAAGIAGADSACTFPVAPYLVKTFGVVDTGALTVATQGPSDVIQLEGDNIVPPGGFAAIYTSTASAAAGFMAHMEWAEPIITT